jgi:hypothetical protein
MIRMLCLLAGSLTIARKRRHPRQSVGQLLLASDERLRDL